MTFWYPQRDDTSLGCHSEDINKAVTLNPSLSRITRYLHFLQSVYLTDFYIYMYMILLSNIHSYGNNLTTAIFLAC